MMDPKIVALQRREFRCSRCGRRSRDKSGVCMACKLDLPNPKRLATDRILAHLRACRAELQRRRAELDEALKEDG